MTTMQLLRRFNQNTRLFPTLALITAIVGIAEFSSLTVFVSAASHSFANGLAAATTLSLIELVAALVIVKIVSNDPTLFARAERIADMVAHFGAIAPMASSVENESSNAMTEDEMNEARLDQEDEEERDEEDTRCGDTGCATCYPENAETDEAEVTEVPSPDQEFPQTPGTPGEEQK